MESAQVAEVYYRLAMNEWFALTGDVQYQDNKYEDPEAGTDIDALTWGLRAVVEFENRMNWTDGELASCIHLIKLIQARSHILWSSETPFK